ncbi:hypothetical protein EUGRSUZ_J03174 [Eucalyptus grandis]|uniref:Uncharacterized protein n=2 Tax=Eucalyptus grandis TaxID=71139 RepID=A0ACC3JAM8_EUCGR|nr:hypothetical protein EUGRSUZ_J03174 [Eucalyptus grandis]
MVLGRRKWKEREMKSEGKPEKREARKPRRKSDGEPKLGFPNGGSETRGHIGRSVDVDHRNKRWRTSPRRSWVN